MPNILLILTDDQGFGDVASHGNPLLDTPNLDDLAAQGVRFQHYYVSPLCAPTRAALLTGRYHPRTRVLSTTGGIETLPAEEVTLPKAFSAAGYATGCFGKWHNGQAYPHTPKGNAFDEFVGFCGGFTSNFFDPVLETNEGKVETRGFITDVLTENAIGFMRRNRNRPFFCYVPFNAPHSPLQCPEELFAKYKGGGLNDAHACLYAECENIDFNVGRLLGTLDALDLAENTIVIFTTDNGAARIGGDRYNALMRGWKGWVDEGGNRVPFFLRWEGRIQGGKVVNELAAHIDVLPTLVELCGIPQPQTLPLDGISLGPLLCEDNPLWPDRRIFTHVLRDLKSDTVPLAPGAVRTAQYRLTVYDDHDELYDMIEDPGQKNDIAAIRSDVAHELRAAYDAWFGDVTSPGRKIIRLPIGIGYEAAPVVELPAQHGSFHGEARFFGKGWENDWATSLRSAEDSISWNVEIVHEGEYRFSLLYTMKAQNAGARVAVTVQDQRLEKTFTEVHDPPEILRPDRIPRWEVNEKEWREESMGTLRLHTGPAKVAVLPVSAPGDETLDIRAVIISITNDQRPILGMGENPSP